jgi:lysine-specific demethylase 8
LSEVDIEDPDLSRFPRFADAEPIEDILEAGEMLFLPSLWWHRISAMDPNIAVNFWWDPPLRTALRWPRLRVLTLSDLRQSLRRRLLPRRDA